MEPQPKKKRYWLRYTALGTGAFFFGTMIGAAGGSSEPAPVASSEPTVVTKTVRPKPEVVTKTVTPRPKVVTKTKFVTKTVKPKPKPAPAAPDTSGVTAAQENALQSAADYLDTSSFSRKGLIEQLKFEGYSTSDATYAADNVGADWNEQAAKSARDYLDTSSFSRSGLIDQLRFEGFTLEQATYGVDQTGL